MEVMHVNAILDDVIAQVIGLPMRVPGTDAAAIQNVKQLGW